MFSLRPFNIAASYHIRFGLNLIICRIFLYFLESQGFWTFSVISLLFQGVLTFSYISLLGAVGERLASRLRKQLFESIITQDIAFFDTHKTGEIVNRFEIFKTKKYLKCQMEKFF